MFIGTVTDIEQSSFFLRRVWLHVKLFVTEEIDHESYCQDFGKVVTFNVKQAWKSVKGPRVQLVTGAGGGDCGYRFEIGETYVVYTRSDEYDSCDISLCSRTNRADLATEDLAFLSSLPGSTAY